MLGALVRKELLDHVLSLRFGLACALCLGVVPAGMMMMGKTYETGMKEYEANQVVNQKMMDGVRRRPWQLLTSGVRFSRPPNPMRAFVQGMDPTLTGTVRVTAMLRNEPHYQPAYSGNPLTYLFQPTDLIFLVGTVMSFLAMGFSYNAVSGEKEQGTLKLLMSFGVPRTKVILAKWLGGYLALIVPLILALTVGLLLVTTVSETDLKGMHWQALVLILGTGLVYLGAMYSLGILVSARTASGSTAILLLLLIWVLMVLVIPNLAPYLAAEFSPTRSPYLVEREKHLAEVEGRLGFSKDLVRWRKAHPEVTERNYWRHYGSQEEEHYLAIAERKKQLTEQFRREMDAQVGLSQALARISPTASFVFAVSNLAGNGITGRHRMEDGLLVYQRQVNAFMEVVWERRRKNREEIPSIADCPVYAFRDLPLEDRVGASVVDLVMLVLWNGVFFAGGYVGFLRYDVR